MSRLSTWAAKQAEADTMKPEGLTLHGMLAARVTAPDSVHIQMAFLKNADGLALARWLVATCGEEVIPTSGPGCLRDSLPLSSRKPPEDLVSREAVRAWALDESKRIDVSNRSEWGHGYAGACDDLLRLLPTLPPSQGTR